MGKMKIEMDDKVTDGDLHKNSSSSNNKNVAKNSMSMAFGLTICQRENGDDDDGDDDYNSHDDKCHISNSTTK